LTFALVIKFEEITMSPIYFSTYFIRTLGLIALCSLVGIRQTGHAMVTQSKNILLPPYGDNHCFFSSDIHEKFWIPWHQKPCHALGNAIVLPDNIVYGIFLTKINEICRYMMDLYYAD
jgi:hypothetical protein